jgi:hypothetical protein
MPQPPVLPETPPPSSQKTVPVSAWKKHMRQLGWAGILFFTVKGILSVSLGAWLIKACSN